MPMLALLCSSCATHSTGIPPPPAAARPVWNFHPDCGRGAHAEAAGVRAADAERGALQAGQTRADLHARVAHARVHVRRGRLDVVQHVARQAACAAAHLRARSRCRESRSSCEAVLDCGPCLYSVLRVEVTAKQCSIVGPVFRV